ncbi:MAG: peptidylprolyl isomerase [Nitrospirota bacterium]
MKSLVLFTLMLTMVLPILASAEDPVVAKIGDEKITMSDLNRIIGYYDPNQQKLFEQNPQAKSTLLRRIVQGMVISKIAKERGFDRDARIKEQLQLLSNDFLAAEYMKKEVIAKIDVAEEDMKLYFKTHPEEFTTPEMVKARHILIKVDKNALDEDKKKAKEKAEDILKKIRAGEDFSKIAAEVSDDSSSKTKGGDLGLFQRGKMVPDFEKVAFSLKPGEISDVFETPFGFHIVKVEEKKDPVIEPYEKVKDKVREKIFAEFRKVRVEEFIEKAMKDEGVELNLEPLME